MKSDFIAQKDYNLIKFNKEQKDIIKRDTTNSYHTMHVNFYIIINH
jgi:hypothetical protein